MKDVISNELGEIIIENEVIAKYAGSAAVECFGVVGMASVNVKDGIVKLLKRDNITHGVNVLLKDDKLRIDLHIIVAYGVSISAVADNLISNVRYKVEEFTGMEIDKINVIVEGVRITD
ncbi:MAG: Asp23/Gls24 family envelope stress response protein [Lachnospiraceae bacterium]|nr:Asp23/Gls24 family envelope stress response protein [Lachnospiraceae bacterium]